MNQMIIGYCRLSYCMLWKHCTEGYQHNTSSLSTKQPKAQGHIQGPLWSTSTSHKSFRDQTGKKKKKKYKMTVQEAFCTNNEVKCMVAFSCLLKTFAGELTKLGTVLLLRHPTIRHALEIPESTRTRWHEWFSLRFHLLISHSYKLAWRSWSLYQLHLVYNWPGNCWGSF